MNETQKTLTAWLALLLCLTVYVLTAKMFILDVLPLHFHAASTVPVFTSTLAVLTSKDA